jgi:hypothetical protein
MEPKHLPCEWSCDPERATPGVAVSADRRFVLKTGCGLGMAALAAAPGAASAFTYMPRPAYRAVAARHVYEVHRQRIFKGKLPPLLYAIAVTETVVDTNGKVLSVRIIRQPAAAKDVGPWVVSLIRSASPFPRPGSRTRFIETWLVDKSKTFQLDSLTEGQL